MQTVSTPTATKGEIMAEQGKGLVSYKARDGQEVQLTFDTVKNYLVTGRKELVTAQELMMYMGTCKARGLNPFARDCYLVKYTENEVAATIVAVAFYESRARAQADCVGWEAGVICQSKKDGTLRYSHGLVLDTEDVVGGWFEAQPTGWARPFKLEVNLREYQKKTKEGHITKFWQNPATMIAKVVTSQGLRKLWPDEFRGTITAEEAGIQIDPLDAMENITPEQGASAPEPKLDTSKFDKAVKKLKWDAETMTRLEKWLADTATGASNKSGKDITPDMIKASCAARFEEFRAKFKEWVAVNFPVPTQETDPEPDVKEPAAAAGPPENEWPPEAAGADKSFSQEQMEAWHAVISSGTPLSALQEIGVSRAADVTPDNIEQVLALAEKFAEAQAKAKK
jgi:phage recombination protein Bet